MAGSGLTADGTLDTAVVRSALWEKAHTVSCMYSLHLYKYGYFIHESYFTSNGVAGHRGWLVFTGYIICLPYCWVPFCTGSSLLGPSTWLFTRISFPWSFIFVSLDPDKPGMCPTQMPMYIFNKAMSPYCISGLSFSPWEHRFKLLACLSKMMTWWIAQYPFHDE